MTPPAAAAEAPWLSERSREIAALILSSHRQLWGAPLLALPASAPERLQAQELFCAGRVVLAHDGGEDPRLIYANRAALNLWRRDWSAMVGMPSRLTAEPSQRQARSGALAEALRREGIADYGGVRVDREGRRFRIEGARLWTLRDGNGRQRGQAACFSRWWWL